MGMNRGNYRPILLLLLCRPPDVDVVHYGDDHDDRDDIDAAGRTIDAPVGVVQDRRSSRSSAGMRGAPQDRATVDANVDDLAVVASSSYTSCRTLHGPTPRAARVARRGGGR